MWVQLHILNFAIIGMLTIFLPMMFYEKPAMVSTFSFFSGIYMVALYFMMLYIKDGRDKLQKENEELKKLSGTEIYTKSP